MVSLFGSVVLLEEWRSGGLAGSLPASFAKFAIAGNIALVGIFTGYDN